MNFDDNVGSDQVVVYAGSLRFYETEIEKYDLHIPITPFRYDPSLGNLLVDIFNYAPISSRRDPDWTVDQADRLFDSVSSLAGRATDTSGFAGTAGMMTRFTYTPVPEPGTLTILVIALLGLGLRAFKRNRK